MTDFVIAWVDGTDDEWLKEKVKYIPDITQDDNNARYRDWGTLKYWFRSVERYAPWVNKIHFLTWGHVPEWLDTENNKIHVVSHKEFIPCQYLPTFNSHTIELNIHRIQGLSEQFVYFNDDMFLTAPCDEDYFFKNGKPCDEFILDAIYFAPDSAGAYNGNNMEIINKHFNLRKMKKNYTLKQLYYPFYGLKNIYRTFVLIKWPWYTGFHYNHLPTSILKSTMEKLWAEEEDVLHASCMDKIRSKRNVNQWLFKYMQLASGNFEPRAVKYGKTFHLKSKINKDVVSAITGQKYKMICINDTVKTKNFEDHKKAVSEAFEKAFPGKCSFEKQ